MNNKAPVKTGLLYKRLFSYVKPFWPILFLGIFANMLYSCIDAGFTYMMRPFLDKGFINWIWLLLKKFLLLF